MNNKLRVILFMFTAVCILLSACGGDEGTGTDAPSADTTYITDSTDAIVGDTTSVDETDENPVTDGTDPVDTEGESQQPEADTTNIPETTEAPATTTNAPYTEEVTSPIDTPITLPFVPVG